MKVQNTTGNDAKLLRTASAFFDSRTLKGCHIVHLIGCDRRRPCECRPRLLLRDGRVITDEILRGLRSRLG